MSGNTLPRKPSSEKAGPRATLVALSDLQDHARLTLETQVKTFDVLGGDLPLIMNTSVATPVGVTCIGAWDAGGTPVYVTALKWALGVVDGDISIAGINGLTTGTKYRVRIKIEGTR